MHVCDEFILPKIYYHIVCTCCLLPYNKLFICFLLSYGSPIAVQSNTIATEVLDIKEVTYSDYFFWQPNNCRKINTNQIN